MWGKAETTIVWDEPINESQVLKKDELKSIEYMDRHRNNTVTEDGYEMTMNMGDYSEPNVARIDLSKGAVVKPDLCIQSVDTSSLDDHNVTRMSVVLNLAGLIVSASTVIYGLPWAFGAIEEAMTNILNSGLTP